jgi:ligand-binding sensor domain-containing protein
MSSLFFFVFSVLHSIIVDPTLDILSVHTIDNGLPSNQVRSIYMDSTIVWIGSNVGHAWLADNEWKRDNRPVNPITKGVSDIYRDSSGNLWFGGLEKSHRYSNDSYTTYDIAEDMKIAGRVVFSFYEDNSNRLWAATSGGASLYDGNIWTAFTGMDSLKHTVVHDIHQDRHGTYWFATRKGGLNGYDGSSWQYRFPDKNCRNIITDNQHTMWVGTSDGLVCFDGKEWHVFEDGNTVLPMFEGDKGFIWCIANGTDILKFDLDGNSVHYSDPTQGKATEIYTLAKASDGTVWAGTDQGIFVFY